MPRFNSSRPDSISSPTAATAITAIAAAAEQKVDTTPMEGFIPFEFDEILGLTERGLSSVIVCPIGYRHEDDVYQNLPKVRRELNTIVEYL